MSIQQITERETALANTLRMTTEALTLVTKERDEYQLEASMWAAELKSLRNSGVELPEPFFGAGRYLSIAGNRDAFTETQLRDYGDRRAMAERERCAGYAERLAKDFGSARMKEEWEVATDISKAIRKGE